MNYLKLFYSRNKAEIHLALVLVLVMMATITGLVLTSNASTAKSSTKPEPTTTSKGIIADAIKISSHALDNKSTAGVVKDFATITSDASTVGQNGPQVMTDIAENVGSTTTVTESIVDIKTIVNDDSNASTAATTSSDVIVEEDVDIEVVDETKAAGPEVQPLTTEEIQELMNQVLECEVGSTDSLLTMVQVSPDVEKPLILAVLEERVYYDSIRGKLEWFFEEIGLPLWIRQLMARVLYNEANNVESEAERSMVPWTMMNRLDGDSWYGNDMYTIISKPGQYSFDDPRHNVVTERNLILVEDVIIRWWLEKQGVPNVGQTLPADVTFFLTDSESPGWHNYFFRLSDGLSGYKIIFDRDHPLSNPYES